MFFKKAEFVIEKTTNNTLFIRTGIHCFYHLTIRFIRIFAEMKML